MINITISEDEYINWLEFKKNSLLDGIMSYAVSLQKSCEDKNYEDLVSNVSSINYLESDLTEIIDKINSIEKERY